MSSHSIKTRFTISFICNVLRAALSFATALLLARRLAPNSYGDLAFLLTSFVAMRSLLDLGSSNAFFTFISGKARGSYHYLLYFSWLLIQFVVMSAFILFISPKSIFESIWLGYPRELVFLAFLAVFFQQQMWLTVNQIAESGRKTVRIQALNVGIACVHFSAVVLLWRLEWLSVRAVLGVIILEYALATLVAARLLRGGYRSPVSGGGDNASVGSILSEFSSYCRPLVLLSFSSFLYDFADRWLLQRYAGSAQQGYFQIAYQAAAVTLIATTSMLNVLWKEIAEAKMQGDLQRMQSLYMRFNRGAVMFGAFLSAFIIPWTPEIMQQALGPAYRHASPVLAIMFLYPIHQAMGQIGGTTFLASGQTRLYTLLGVGTMLASLPLSYFMQAPESSAVPGLGLGAMGLALKLVGVNVLSVNLQAFFLSRHFGWPFDWSFQLVGIGLLITFGFIAKWVAVSFWSPATFSRWEMLGSITLSGIVYLALACTALFLLPEIAGVEKALVQRMTRKALAAS